KPYATWKLDLPFDAPYGGAADTENRQLGGAAYDPATGRLFLSQVFDDGRTPLIHVYTVHAPDAASSAVVCLPGTYLAAPGDAACTPAPAGSYVSASGATAATLCPAGTYSPTAGATACTQAPAGSYVSTAGATSATV